MGTVAPGGSLDRSVRARTVIGEVIDRWDPCGLLALGAPANEYDPEVDDLAGRLSELTSAEACARQLSEVFQHWFGPSRRFEAEHLREVGDALFGALSEARLVGSAPSGPRADHQT